MDGTTLLPLIGIPIVVIGFALRFNPLLVVVVAGLATGLLVGMDFGMLLETFGEKFVNSRSLATFILILPIGLLEYYGLKERAAWGGEDRQRHLGAYSDAFVAVKARRAGRCRWAPCPDGAPAAGADGRRGGAERIRRTAAHPRQNQSPRRRVRQHRGLLWGRYLYCLRRGAADRRVPERERYSGIEPLHIGLWAIPTAIAALVIHMTRLLRLDASIRRDVMAWRAEQGTQEAAQ
jgi:hypothetical protein